MARMHSTPRFPTGTRVRKRFPGYADPFSGEIDAFLPDSGFYHILYDDGDSEEMTEDDVERHYYRGPRKKEKRPKVASLSPLPSPTSKRSVKHGQDVDTKPRTKMLLLSASGNGTKKRKARAIVEEDDDEHHGDDDDGLADGEQEDDDEAHQEHDEDDDDDDEQEIVASEVKEVTSADSIYKLVGQRVCKRQTEGVVSGTVSSYFPATKMYRVVYSNGTTDDMTYREVVDSIPLSATGAAAKNNKRKPAEETAAPATGVAVPSPSPKKRKLGDKVPKNKKAATANENVNSENTAKAVDPDTKRPSEVDADSAMAFPTMKEDDFVWNHASAYEIVRAVLYVVASTNNEKSESVKVLEQKDLKAKQALVSFVECGGLGKLEERLGLWCKTKETEAGVLAILKVLAVLPGVTREAVMTSNIGKTLGDIRKKRGVCPVFDPIVQDLVTYVIAKWKREFGMGEKKSSKLAVEAKSKPSLSTSVSSKSIKGSTIKAEPPSSGANHKRSNSVGHLRDLIGGPRGNQSRNSDLLGNSLTNARPGSRPLGAPHARSARRSTVLLDSIMNRLKTAEADRSSPNSGDRSSLKPDVWTASRVKFGGHSTLEFDNELEVSMLMIAPVPGAIRPFKSKSGPPKPPAPDKQPAKSILRVKLDAAERDANAAILRAEESRQQQAGTLEQTRVGSVSTTDSSLSGVPMRPSIGEDGREEGEEVEAAGDRDEEEGDVSITVAPPSPPRKHDASDDEEIGGGDDDDADLPPMPDDLMIGEVPSPPTSDTVGEQAADGVEPTAMEVDAEGEVQNRVTQEPLKIERVASPVVSSDSSDDESDANIEQDGSSMHQQRAPPSSPPRRSTSPSLRRPPAEATPPVSDNLDVDSTTATVPT